VRDSRWFRRWSRRSRCSSQTSGCIARYCGRYLRLHRHGVNCWLYRFRSHHNGRRNLRLDRMLSRLGCFPGCSSGGRGRRCRRGNRQRFHGNSYRRRRTRHGLRRDKARRWLGCLHGCSRRGSRGYRRRLGNAARRTRRYSRRRRNSLTRRRGRRGGCTRRSSGLRGFLGNRLQHVSRLGDVRQVDLGLELFSLCTRATTGGAAGLSVLTVILPHALRFIHFNGAGVRFLFCDSDLE
jgi:hypothetical protein